MSLTGNTPCEGVVVLKTSNTLEIEGSDKPTLIAEIVGADNTQRICLRRGNTRRKR